MGVVGIRTLTKLKFEFFSQLEKVELLGFTPPTSIKITAMKVKMVGRRVTSRAKRAIFASDLSYNMAQNTCQKCLPVFAFQGQIAVETSIEEFMR